MSDKEQLTFEFDERPTIKGFPELRWTGKRPYKYTQYFPAQLRERYGEETDGWINKIFWGDNLQVMSHMLKEYRGQIDMIYIDPPFDSKAQYKKTIKINSKDVSNDMMSFEEVQYKDIWTNDTYLQFLYERLIIMRELLKDTGSIWVHCDQSKGHYIKIILDEVFGQDNFVNQITWKRTFAHGDSGQGAKHLGRISDYIYLYGKSSAVNLNSIYVPYEKSYIERVFSGKDDDGRRWQSVSLTAPGGASKGNPSYNFLGVTRYWQYSKANMEKLYAEGKIYQSKPGAVPRRKMYLDEAKGVPLQDIWTDIVPVQGLSNENENYPTQKPITLLERIIKLTSNPGDLVFDCFMGSGTTQAVAMKLGRRFIGADINLGAVQTTTKRLLHIADNLRNELGDEETKYTGFEVYNVNNYDFFRNPVEARDLLIQALEIQPFSQSNVWDGELDGRMVKIMPVNRIATKADLEELKANLPYKIYEKRKEDNPNQPVERITIVCMGHEPDLKAALEVDLDYKLDIEIVDILRDKSELQLKREAEAEIVRENDKLVIRAFYPMNLLQKLSLQKEYVDDWRQLVESIMIDWNYDGVVLQPSVTDIPGKKEMVGGVYDIPKNAGTIKVKITDLLSESLEMEV
ncbi:site-specific DNA-methyltransferase [Phascolarctobacterium succinatutens]|uniref:site-specific DNA-methyltransferase n=1 Tax=Phascolarctobacterium succinatutens TaxID=626940 RepID=UPI003FD7B2D5